MAKQAVTTLRMPAETWQMLRDEHARTYPLHRLSLNVWLLSRIQLSFTIKDPAANPPR